MGSRLARCYRRSSSLSRWSLPLFARPRLTMYPIATAATSVHARGASKLSACCAATSTAAITPTIAQNSVVRNEAFVSSRRATVGWDFSKRRSFVVMSRVAICNSLFCRVLSVCPGGEASNEARVCIPPAPDRDPLTLGTPCGSLLGRFDHEHRQGVTVRALIEPRVNDAERSVAAERDRVARLPRHPRGRFAWSAGRTPGSRPPPRRGQRTERPALTWFRP